jgi:hypothetical protein
MRKQTSLFNRACDFINSHTRGDSFLTKDYISAIGKYENVTSWKRYSKNKHYNCHQYKGYLRKAGFISQTKRGEWRIEEYIPYWFDLGHLSILLGYHKWDPEARKHITTYKGMSREDILEKLKNPFDNKETYGTRIDQAAASNPGILKTAQDLANLISETVDEIGKSKNYYSQVNKIDNDNGPKMRLENSKTVNTSEEKKTSKMKELIDMTDNIVRLEQAFDLLTKCHSQDTFMRGRIYNVQVLVQDILSAHKDKRDFLTNTF